VESRGLAPTAHTHMDDAKWRCPISIGHRRCRETLDASHAGTKAPNLSDRQPTVNRNKRLSAALGASAYSALKFKEMVHGSFKRRDRGGAENRRGRNRRFHAFVGDRFCFFQIGIYRSYSGQVFSLCQNVLPNVPVQPAIMPGATSSRPKSRRTSAWMHVQAQ